MLKFSLISVGRWKEKVEILVSLSYKWYARGTVEVVGIENKDLNILSYKNNR